MGLPSNSQFSTDPTKSTTFALTTRAAASDARHVIVIDQRRTDLGPTLIQLWRPALGSVGSGLRIFEQVTTGPSRRTPAQQPLSVERLLWRGWEASQPGLPPRDPAVLERCRDLPGRSRERAFHHL